MDGRSARNQEGRPKMEPNDKSRAPCGPRRSGQGPRRGADADVTAGVPRGSAAPGTRAALIESWQRRARGLPAAQQQVRQAAFHMIRLGQVATAPAVAARTGMRLHAAQTALAALREQGLIVEDTARGGIVGVYGLSLLPTAHALDLDGQALFTWCALDAVGIPAALQAEARIRSHCFMCPQVIACTCTAGTVTPDTAVEPLLWITAPVAGPSLRSST